MKLEDSGLKTDTHNANLGTQRGRGLLEKSLRKLGAGRSILADKNGNIVAGNKTLEGAAEIGLPVRIVETDGKELVVVKRMDLDLYSETDKRGRTLAYADNKIAELDLAWSPEQINADFAPLDLGAWGFVDPSPEVADAEPQIDRAAELNEKWQVKTGDLWKIGDHRLLCGDSTDAAGIALLMNGERAQMCFTSPPYNAGKTATERKTGKESKYEDDLDIKDDVGYLDLLCGFTDAALLFCDYLFCNIQVLSGNKKPFIDYWHKFHDVYCDVMIWDKQTAQPAMARKVTNSRFEFVLIFGGNGSRSIGTKDFRGTVENVYCGNPQRNNDNADIHSATFPLDLPTHFIDTFTNVNEIIYEPFAGSGTTLVACQNLSRKCRAIEISPNYCSVILQRMQDAFPELVIERL